MAQISLCTTSRKQAHIILTLLNATLGFTGYTLFFLISAQNRLWVFVRTASSMAVLTGTHILCIGHKSLKRQVIDRALKCDKNH